MSMRHFRTLLLVGTALSTPALAQTAAPADSATAPVTVTKIGRVQAGGSGFPPTPEGVTGDQAGGGLIMEEDAPKQRSTVSTDAILKQEPTANVFKYLELSPGASSSVTDPYGETGGNIVVRGLNSNQIGFTLEGAPLNDNGTFAFYPQQYVDGENLQMISLAQGSADLDSPTIGASGGVVNMYLRDPATKFGGLYEQSFGSYSMNREFARIDTGLIGGTNLRGFISYSHLDDDHYRGPGSDQRDHIDLKFLDSWGDNRIAFAVMANRNINSYYNNPTLAQFATHSVNYDASFNPASPDANFWKLHLNPYLSIVSSAPAHFALADNWSLDVTPYLWWDEGAGGGAGSAFFLNDTFYTGTQKNVIDLQGNGTTTGKLFIDNLSLNPEWRPGVVVETHYTLGANKFVGGYWYDYSQQHTYSVFSTVGSSGTPDDIWAETNFIRLANGQTASNVDLTAISDVNAVFGGDTISLFDDKMNIDLGIKANWINRTITNNLPGASPASLSISDSQVVPEAAVRYNIDGVNQVFASIAENFRSPPVSEAQSQYSYATGAQTALGVNTDKDENSWVEELGYRYQGDLADAAVTYFHYNFYNRQISTLAVVSGITESQTLNVGATTSDGIDMEIGLKPWRHFRPYASAEVLRAITDSNYKVGNNYLPTDGKYLVRSPRFQAALSLDYDDGTYFSTGAIKYVGSQYATFMNDQKIPEHATADITLGARLPDFYYAKQPEIRLNLENITDTRFLSGVAGIQPNAKATVATNGATVNPAATPTYYMGSGFAAILTLNVPF